MISLNFAWTSPDSPAFLRGGLCKAELQYIMQVVPSEKLLVLKMEEHVMTSSLGMFGAPLSKVRFSPIHSLMQIQFIA